MTSSISAGTEGRRMEKESAFELGRRHADLFLGFSCFLKEQAELGDIDTLFFCTREGVFFKAVFEALFNRPESAGQLNTVLLEVSRLSSFAPSLVAGQSIDIAPLFKLYASMSPDSILRSLGQDPGESSDLMDKHGLDREEQFGNPSASRLAAFLNDPVFIQRVHPRMSEQRSALNAYLQHRLGTREKVGFVEIGWRGTIQNSVAQLFPKKTFHGMYLGLALERQTMNSNCRKTAYGPDRNISAENADLLDAINVLEFVCLSTGGSAQGYETHPDGSVTARMQHFVEEDACIAEFSVPYQQGVLSAAAESDAGAVYQAHLSGPLRASALDRWRDLLCKPNPFLVETYFKLKSNEQFGRGTISDQAAVPTFATVMLAPFSSSRRQQLTRYLTYSQWVEGMLRRNDLRLFQRLVFSGLMRIARKYKHRVHSSRNIT
jgi:hypothetical protein